MLLNTSHGHLQDGSDGVMVVQHLYKFTVFWGPVDVA